MDCINKRGFVCEDACAKHDCPLDMWACRMANNDVKCYPADEECPAETVEKCQIPQTCDDVDAWCDDNLIPCVSSFPPDLVYECTKPGVCDEEVCWDNPCYPTAEETCAL